MLVVGSSTSVVVASMIRLEDGSAGEGCTGGGVDAVGSASNELEGSSTIVVDGAIIRLEDGCGDGDGVDALDSTTDEVVGCGAGGIADTWLMAGG